MTDFFEQYHSIIAKANAKRDSMQKKFDEDPEMFIKELGIDLSAIDYEKLIKAIEELSQNSDLFSEKFNNKNFTNLNNNFNNIKDKSQITSNEARKLEELSAKAFNNDLKDTQKFCFIENDKCNHIINAHSIQENGELSLISKGGKVIQFIQNINSKKKEKNEVHIGKASTFKGFCHYHDQIFEPIDKKKFASDSEKYFLYSLRSFAHSYYNLKSYKDYYLNLIEQGMNSINPLINLANAIGYKLPDELYIQETLPKSKDQIESLEIERFAKQSQLLKQYIETQNFTALDYKVYKINHLCPVVCASWMVMHIAWGDGFLIVNNEQKPYYGFPIILSILPEKNGTKIILARFKSDQGSDLIFNNFESIFTNERDLELEVSKLIIENVENFYLSPVFWDRLESADKEIIMNAINADIQSFPQSRTKFQILNFFDKKYKLD